MEPADLALVIALDGSASVNFNEFNAIVGGIAAALRDPEVMVALQGGPQRASLLSVLLWSGIGAHEVMIDWTRVDTDAAINAFAEAVGDVPRTVRAGETAIGEALVVAETMLAALPAPASRRIIDVAGDGRSNAGIPPAPIRDRLIAAGVTINGLCVLHEEPDLLQSYTTEVIGGPGAFAVECKDYDTFAEAMRRKLVRELSSL
ncbi:DUF1194 domain-containing protein [Acidisphaera sp. L21]|uniref:DUF1194 domain-containing protein n=1 Tax=Acidisphaera sp. L21 TaxID=1641851 RepID=UPI00131B7C9D